MLRRLGSGVFHEGLWGIASYLRAPWHGRRSPSGAGRGGGGGIPDCRGSEWDAGPPALRRTTAGQKGCRSTANGPMAGGRQRPPGAIRASTSVGGRGRLTFNSRLDRQPPTSGTERNRGPRRCRAPSLGAREGGEGAPPVLLQTLRPAPPPTALQDPDPVRGDIVEGRMGRGGGVGVWDPKTLCTKSGPTRFARRQSSISRAMVTLVCRRSSRQLLSVEPTTAVG